MLPITSFLSCTEPIDQFECFSTRQKHHAKTYVTGLVAAWHLLMLAYSLLKFGAAHSAFGTILGHASSLRNDVKRSFRESVQNLLSWALTSPNRSIDGLMQQINGMFV
ncbi:IS4 transposase [Halapricum desulfuricans]|uniref:IS4 transposase n=1 Tax=Halapricum desulfuricans TaxID=2841257 RepID=A0A897N701_9EURY|nr:IS4 transposase [Halapricum desulfuricans]